MNYREKVGLLGEIKSPSAGYKPAALSLSYSSVYQFFTGSCFTFSIRAFRNPLPSSTSW